MKLLVFILIFTLSTPSMPAQSWENVGNGLEDNVYDLQKFNGKLYIAGRVGVKYWDGTTWTTLPRPFAVSLPLTMEIFKDTLYLGGSFSNSSAFVQKFSGSEWKSVGSDFDGDWVSIRKLHTYNDQLIAAGHFTSVDQKTVNHIAAWDGKVWTALGKGFDKDLGSLTEYSGDLIASGNFFTSGDDTTGSIARWNGTGWSPLSNTHSFNSGGAMISYNGKLFIGSVTDTINNIPMQGVAIWDGQNFVSGGNNLLRGISNFWIFNNELYAGASLYTLNPNGSADVVLKWSGSYWQQVGPEFDQPILAIDDFDNQLFAAGFFKSPTKYVARLNTTTSIRDIGEPIPFRFYPNPALDKITLLTGLRGNASIINQLGQIVLEVPVNNYETQISTSKLTQGVYILIVKSGMESIAKKLIITQ